MVMNFSGFAGFHNQADLSSLARLNQVLVHSAAGDQSA